MQGSACGEGKIWGKKQCYSQKFILVFEDVLLVSFDPKQPRK